MIIAQWAACVMLMVTGLCFAGATGLAVKEKDPAVTRWMCATIAILAIAAAIAVRP